MDGSSDHPSAEYRDALPSGPARGRGAGLNPGNRFEGLRLHVLGEHLDAEAGEAPEGRQVLTRVGRDATRTIINKVDSPDLGLEWTLNPYRGCEHGCVYCYARPTHEYLGLSCGLDFETKIIAKHDAAELFRKAVSSPRWSGEPVMLSGITDPYQPVEAELRLTRGCLEVARELGQPVSLITKNKLILRDLDILAELAAQGRAHAAISLTTLDNRTASAMEPRASSPGARLQAIRELTRAGVPVRVMMAPIVPGLTDHEVPAVLEAAAEAGATCANYVLLRLPHQIKDLFLEWLARHVPDRAGKVESLIRETRGGELYDARHFVRHRGEGAYAEQIRASFAMFRRRHGLEREPEPLKAKARAEPGQLGLFG